MKLTEEEINILNKRVEKYLKEYVELCIKHDLHIDGYDVCCIDNSNIKDISKIETTTYDTGLVVIDYNYKRR